jgi:dimethylargininase
MADPRITRHAIVRPPGASFAAGITTAGLGAPDLELALAQHRAYCAALVECGVEVESLPADDRFPDSTFIEDTAVLVPGCAVLTRPGAESRRGEVDGTSEALGRRFTRLEAIAPPGTVDGGDICETSACVLIGISERTNPEGAAALARLLAASGVESRRLDVRGSGLLHMKSGLTDLGDGRLLVSRQLSGREELAGFATVEVEPVEEYAANAVRVNGRVLIAAGFPRIAGTLRRLGYAPLPLEMSEFRKMDGGLSCLSLRF